MDFRLKDCVDNKMKKILITGASGFIGKNLKNYFEQKYDLYAPSHKELDLLNSRMTEQYLRQHKFDVVLHSAVQGTLGMPEEFSRIRLKNNLRMFYNLKRCSQCFEKMFYYGSGAEYGREIYKPLMPEIFFGQTVPEDDYGLSKYIMAENLKENENIYDLCLFGVFGPFENYNYRFISNVICKSLRKRQIRIHQNTYFDYLYITDLCRITEWFLEHKPGYHRYNVCTSNRVDILSIAEMIVQLTENSSEIIIEQDGLGIEYSGDNSRLIKEIGGFKFTPIRDAIQQLVAYYRNVDFELKGNY